MKGFFETADRIPITLLVTLAYLTLAGLSGMRFSLSIVDSNPEFLERVTALGSHSAYHVFQGEYWRLITHAFLHLSLLHLAFNTYALLIFGPALEQSLGSKKFALLYFVSAVGGGLLAQMWNSHAGSHAGGSGALFGLAGGFLGLLSRSGRSPLDFTRTPGGRQFLGWIAINLLIGVVMPVISNSAHIGGLVSGFALTVLFLVPGRLQPDRLFRITQVGWCVLLVAATLYCCAPVANRHYMLQRWLAAEDPAERSAYATAMLNDPQDLATTLASYREPEALWSALEADARR